MARLIAGFLCLPLAALVLGCGNGPSVGHVTGTVKFKGEVLTSGSVVLVTADGLKKGGAISPKGTYSIRDVPVALARVTVFSHSRVPEGLQVDLGQPAAPNKKGAEHIRIPSRYEDPDKSGLFLEVR